MPLLPRRETARDELRSDDVAALGLDLDDGETGGVPAAAEGFDEQDAGDEALAVNDGELLLILQQVLLCGDDIEVVHQAALVAAGGNVEGATRCINGLLLFLLRFA